MKFLFYLVLNLVIATTPFQSLASEILLKCEIEHVDTLIKIESPFWGGKKVFFNRNGDWNERTVIKENDEYLWVHSDFGYGAEPIKGCDITRCNFDFQFELLEKRLTDSVSALKVYRVANNNCTTKLKYQECKNFRIGERMNDFICVIQKPLK